MPPEVEKGHQSGDATPNPRLRGDGPCLPVERWDANPSDMMTYHIIRRAHSYNRTGRGEDTSARSHPPDGIHDCWGPARRAGGGAIHSSEKTPREAE